MLKVYNTLTKKKEVFKPLREDKVGLYTCGPTVYNYAHIGNLRTYIFEDTLKRVLIYNSYNVKHVMNITDVGHLTGDMDMGEDKLEAGARRESKTAQEIAQKYTDAFKNDLKRLNLFQEEKNYELTWLKATETIKEQIEMIKILEEKRCTYKTSDGIYFDTSKFKDYTKLSHLNLETLKEGARIERNEEKKNPTDFALWKFSEKPGIRQQEWESPWGIGFPGWHLECSVMSSLGLKEQLDVHCGGIDHINIHHTNEIAQYEAAYPGKEFFKYWMHGEFLITEEKMSKSKGNIIILENLIEKGFNPLAYRYLTLTAHYRSKLKFTWQNLEAAQNALDKLYSRVKELREHPKIESSHSTESYEDKFLEIINDDLNMPKAIALLWGVIERGGLLTGFQRYELAKRFDKVFGLDLDKLKKQKIPKQVLKLAKEREKYRKEKSWSKADQVRKKIESLGYQIEDTKDGTKITKLN